MGTDNTTWLGLFCLFLVLRKFERVPAPSLLYGSEEAQIFQSRSFGGDLQSTYFQCISGEKTEKLERQHWPSWKIIIFFYDEFIVKFIDELYILQFGTNSLQDIYNFW